MTTDIKTLQELHDELGRLLAEGVDPNKSVMLKIAVETKTDFFYHYANLSSVKVLTNAAAELVLS